MANGPIKVLGIVCSPRKNGNTEILVKEALAGAEEVQAQTELLTLGDKDIKPCDGCRACAKTGKCHIRDDMHPLYTKLFEADALIFGSPIYVWSITGQGKVFLDRIGFLSHKSMLGGKVGGVVVVGSMGHANVLSLFHTFFANNGMVIGDFVMGFGGEKGEIRKDRYACLASREAGKRVVAIAQQRFKLPEVCGTSLRSTVKEKYGFDSVATRRRFDATGSD